MADVKTPAHQHVSCCFSICRSFTELDRSWVSTPILSFILLCWNGTAQIRDNIWIDDATVFAVTVPMLAAAFGFVAGALAAAVHNVLAKSQRHRAVRISKPSEVQTASLRNVA